MSSPNPFNQWQGTPPAPPHLRGEVTLSYPEVAPITCVTFRRGRAAIRLNPYSREHAYLTGHNGSPSVRGGRLGGRLDVQDPQHSPDIGSTAMCATKAPDAGPSVLIARFVGSPGDIPEPALASNIRGPCRDAPSLAESSQMVSGTVESNSGLAHTPRIEREAGLDAEEGDPDAKASTPLPEFLMVLAGVEVAVKNRDEAGVVAEEMAEDGASDAGRLSPGANDPGPAQYVAVPEEQKHRRFLRYTLRAKGRQVLKHKIGRQAETYGLPFDKAILRQARIKKFNPAVNVKSDTDLLYDCASATAKGITISQFGRLFKRCTDCDRYFFGSRLNRGHDCNGAPVDLKARDFYLTAYLFQDHCLGLSEEEFEELLTVCDTCFRVMLIKHEEWHRCPPAAGDSDFMVD